MNRWTATAERQHGVITRTQLRACDMSDRRIHTLIASGRIERVHPGVFRVAGSPRTPAQVAMAACLWCGTGALLSHVSAAALFRLHIQRSDVVHVTVPQAVRREATGVRLHRSDLIVARDRYLVDGMPCTSPTRTVIDLAATLDAESLEHVFEAARHAGLTTTSVLARRASELCGSGRPGSAAIAQILRSVDRRPVESRLEVKTARLLRAHGLQPPANQFVVGPYRLDFAWPLLHLAVECDGFEHHGRRLLWKRDRRRIAALEAQCWRIIHVTWEDVTRRPTETIARIQLALARAA
jgi:very-short-patch-repair endonuclease